MASGRDPQGRPRGHHATAEGGSAAGEPDYKSYFQNSQIRFSGEPARERGAGPAAAGPHARGQEGGVSGQEGVVPD